MRKPYYSWALGLWVFAQVLTASAVYADTLARPVIPVYECHRAPHRIRISGKLDDPGWQKADVIDNFMIPVTYEPAQSKTEGRILWDDKYLYVGFKAYDKDIWSYYTKKGSRTCDEDCLEIFLKPDEAALPYCNFEINALGTVYNALSLSRYAGGGDCHRWARWNCKGLKVKTFIKGTLNNPRDVDEYWQLEVAIPLAELPLAGGKLPKAGDTWTFHLARYDYSIYLSEGVELSSCAALTAGSFHNAPDWCTLKFLDN